MSTAIRLIPFLGGSLNGQWRKVSEDAFRKGFVENGEQYIVGILVPDHQPQTEYWYATSFDSPRAIEDGEVEAAYAAKAE